MPFIDKILNYKTLSIIGMEKNTGKTEVLNYILQRFGQEKIIPAITSIGIDGETTDLVTNTKKPEIELLPGTLFVSSEKHYKQRKLDSEILNVSTNYTALGRLITARAKSKGKLIISGPADTYALKQTLGELLSYNPQIAIVDGALSRKSIASPAITESMILTTGAAFSANFQFLVKQTAFLHKLMCIPKYCGEINDEMLRTKNGIYTIDENNSLQQLDIPSVFLLDKNIDKLFEHGNKIFVSGVINDKFLDVLRVQKQIAKLEIIVKDFTRIFATQQSYQAFLDNGGKLSVLLGANLVAVCVNPTSPSGMRFDSEKLQNVMSEYLGGIPVYDIKKI